MAERVVMVKVDLTVSEGKLDAFMSIAETMTSGSRTEHGTLGYEWFSSGDKKRFRLVETYANADAVLAHFTGPVVTQLVPKLAEVCSIDGIEVYGDPGKDVTGLAAGFGAEIFHYQLGINR
jgi:quinol monooxygenase YgiN